MPVRLRIMFLFSLLVFIILGMVCTSVYYFSYKSRSQALKTRLTNRAITTAKLLSQSGYFDRQMVERIDSLTTLSLQNKAVQAYNFLNQKIYNYTEAPGDTIHITPEMLDDARVKQTYYFTQSGKEAIAYHYTDQNSRIVIICSANDVEGKKNLFQLRNILMLSFIAGITIALISGFSFQGSYWHRLKR